MFNYVIEFRKYNDPGTPDIIKVKSDDPTLSIKHMSWLYQDFISGVKLTFFLQEYDRDYYTMDIQSLQDWGETLPILIMKPETENV